jgi:hypothetical protein
MTFIISPRGVQNTEGTTAKFGNGGSVLIGGNFHNSGNVEVDTRANLSVLGDIINSGNFNIKDYIKENNYKLIENAITDLNGDPKSYLETVYQNLKINNIPEANCFFNRFVSYIKNHPDLITGSIQILLQIFGLNIEKK